MKGVYLKKCQISNSKFQCVFKQDLSAQYCLMSMIEKRRKPVDKEETFATVLTDLFRVFHCLPNDLTIANLILLGLVSQPQSLRIITCLIESKEQR